MRWYEGLAIELASEAFYDTTYRSVRGLTNAASNWRVVSKFGIGKVLNSLPKCYRDWREVGKCPRCKNTTSSSANERLDHLSLF